MPPGEAVHALFLQQFRSSHEGRLHGAVVRRLVCVAHGFLLELHGRGETWELALLGAPGAAWAFLGGAGTRKQLLGDLGTAAPALLQAVSPAPLQTTPPALEDNGDELTALDALRAWLLRPAPAAPGWFRLQGARLLGLRTRAADRRLWLDFEASAAMGEGERLELVAELIDRSANFVLRDAAGGVLAAWRKRRAAPEPPGATGTAAATSETPAIPTGTAAITAVSGAEPAAPVFAAWDTAANRVHAVPYDCGLSLTTAAYLELTAACAVELQGSARRNRVRQKKRLEARVRRLQADAERANQAAQWRRQGELLAANLHRVKRGQKQLIVDDYYAPGHEVALALDPKLSPQENVAHLFKQARRAERGRVTIEARLHEAQTELDALYEPATGEASGAAAWLEVLQAMPASWSDALPAALQRAGRRLLWSPGGPPWEAPVEAVSPATAQSAGGPGRCFVLAGDWEIRVGRNNAENDELTHRFAQADDIWLHASGVPGSLVVLRMKGRKGNPPREIREMAAAIAARYSQAKHAGTVPVLWTRKRYVRKPRRAAPGLAQCTHEKTLFVRPGLPASSAEQLPQREPRRSKRP